MYEKTDQIITILNRILINSFRKLKTLASFDKLNVIRDVNDMYEKVLSFAIKNYKKLAIYYYGRATYGKKERKMDDWVDEYLAEYNPLTKYIFVPELERKKGRLIEIVANSDTKTKDIDASLRLWSKMFTQYAEDITFDVTIQGYKDIGVKKVIWQTENDTRVCPVCQERDGRVFDIDKVPNKPHIGCRCWVKPY